MRKLFVMVLCAVSLMGVCHVCPRGFQGHDHDGE